MSFTAMQALKAYGQAVNTAKVGGAGGAEGGAAKLDFGAMVKDAMNSVASDTAKAEQMAVGSATGKVDLIEVVSAVNEAEMTLQTVVAVRDQVIRAYQDILRMPI
jgi:flagellar hook-basal body complex protein FliE